MKSVARLAAEEKRMTSRILTACAIVALTVGTQASAQDLPAWNPQSICIEDATPEHCRFLEGQARSSISQQWSFIPSLIRERCLASSADEGTQSWRIFGDCLADAARAPQQAAAAESGAAASAPEDTVAADELAALRAELDAAQQRLQDLEGASDGGDADSTARITELEGALKAALSQRESGDERIAGLQQRLMNARAARDEVSSTATADREAMLADLDKATARARAAEFRSNALQASLVAAIAKAKAASEAADESQNDRIAELETALATAETEAKRGNARIEGLQTRLMALSADADEPVESDGSAERIAELEASLATAETENKRSTARIAGLQERLVAAIDAAQGDDAPAADTAELEEKVTTLEAALAKAETNLRSREVRIEGLQQRLLEANSETSSDAPADNSAEVNALQNRLDVASSRIENLQSRLRSGRASSASIEEQYGKSERNLANARTRIAALQDAMIDARRTAQEDAAMKAEAASTASADAERFKRLLENQRDRSSRVAAIVSEQRNRIRELENENRSLSRAAPSVAETTTDIASCQQKMAEIVEEGGIQFGNNKAEIRADAAKTIDQLIVAARECEGAKLTVRGHTDVLGDRAYNVYLSELRAAAVVDYMTRNGIAPDRIDAIGVGPDEPVADNRTRAGRALNRRIEILVQ